MLLLNFTGLGTFPDKERTQAKTAHSSLYLTELNLELAVRGMGGGWREELLLLRPAFSCRWAHPDAPSPTPSDTPLWHLSAHTGHPRKHTHYREPAWKVRGLGAPWQPGLGSPL